MKVSVIVAGWNGAASLRRCLQALGNLATGDVEIIVVSNQFPGMERQTFPSNSSVRFIEAPASETVPMLRTTGLSLSTGEIVALTEDNCVARPDWIEQIIEAHDGGSEVVAGAIENAKGSSLLACAVYFFDYAMFAPGVSSGSRLSGTNVSFCRERLESLRETWAYGFIEFEIENALRAEAVPVFRSHGMQVVHNGSYEAGAIVCKFFRGGRFYGGMRRDNSSAAAILVRIGIEPLVPAVLLLRTLSRILFRPRLVGQYLLSLPWLVVLSVAWSLGEWLGYILGKGSSSSHWR